MNHVVSARRYALLKYFLCVAEDEVGLALTWQRKQKRAPGYVLPPEFPHAAVLAAAHYTTREDLLGADENELTNTAGFSRRDARVVLLALAGRVDPDVGYQMRNGRWAFTDAVALLGEAMRTTITAGDPVEVDRGTARLTLLVLAADGQAPTLDVAVETRHDDVDAWRSLGAFAQHTAPGVEHKCFAGVDRFLRAVATVGGASPSFTFSVSGEAA